MHQSRSFARKALLVCAAALVPALMLASPAAAATDDRFEVKTTNNCGSAEFVDYGTYSNGSSNDDFVKVHDYCSDGHGVRAWALRWDGSQWISHGTVYNGNGLAGAPVFWDPFGNVTAGTYISLRVCLVDGPNDTTCENWVSTQRQSVDG